MTKNWLKMEKGAIPTRLMFGKRDIICKMKLNYSKTSPQRKSCSLKKNEDLVINFDILSENNLIRKYCGLRISQKQLRMGRMVS
jgi:hypothetical protein